MSCSEGKMLKFIPTIQIWKRNAFFAAKLQNWSLVLVYFSCENFKVFRDQALLDMRAVKEETHRETHVYEHFSGVLSLLKSSALFGPNASGKSSVFEALRVMRTLVVKSASGQVGDPLLHFPFRLDAAKQNAPTTFEIEFLIHDTRFRYGFAYDRVRVHEEWLFSRKLRKNARETMLFERQGEQVDLGPALRNTMGVLVREKLIRDNALLVSVAAQFNIPQAIEVVSWFRDKLILATGLIERGGGGVMETYDWVNESRQRKKVFLELLRAADFGIVDFREKPAPSQEVLQQLFSAPDFPFRLTLNDVEEKKVRFGVETAHRLYASEPQSSADLAFFDLFGEESAGTERFFVLAGTVLRALAEGRVLFVDEFDARLHFELARMLISLFHAKGQVKSQLILTSHNLLLIDKALFRRDQIWLLEKDVQEAASLYSLAEFRSTAARKEHNWLNKYLDGRFGGLPLVERDLQWLFDEVEEMPASQKNH